MAIHKIVTNLCYSNILQAWSLVLEIDRTSGSLLGRNLKPEDLILSLGNIETTSKAAVSEEAYGTLGGEQFFRPYVDKLLLYDDTLMMAPFWGNKKAF